MDTAAQKSQSSPSSQRPAKILVVEDSADQWLLFQKAIQQVNPHLIPVLARDQPEAVEFLEKELRNESSSLQLILLDLYLPRRKEGWQTLQTIQALLPPARQVPIFILTSSHDLEETIDSYQQGIQSYLIKPKTFPDWLSCCQILSDYVLAYAHR
ncbi:hypothetical protein GCM10027299_26940 [Larkinella ripae]